MKRTLFALTVILLLPIGAAASVAVVGGLLSIVALLSPIILLGGALICANELAKAILDPSKNKQINKDNTILYGIKYFSLATFAFLSLLVPIAAACVVIAALVSTLALPILTVVIPFKITAKLFSKCEPNDEDELTSKVKTVIIDELDLSDEGMPSLQSQRSLNQEPSSNSAPLRFFAGIQEMIIHKVSELTSDNTSNTRP